VNRFIAFAKWPSKTRYLCRKSWKVSACNPYLVQWAKQFNRNVVLLPTTIDLQYHRPLPKAPLPGRRPVIGWTGSRSTVRYLELIRPVLRDLQLRRDFEFRVICDVDPDFSELANYRFVPWRKETEIGDLSAFDIGLMPVPQGEWELGKVGFKAIQYSGVEAVPVVSSTGSGHEVVIDGETGFVVDNTPDAWMNALCQLIDKPDLISRMGTRARRYIDARYSVRSQEGTYLSLFSDSQ
jgi:glycosyltransferase involved in cell wall biosynthesis